MKLDHFPTNPGWKKIFELPPPRNEHWIYLCTVFPTVDGSEIRRSQVEVGRFSHYLQAFYTSPVVQDFFHQQYQPVTALRHRCVAASWPVQTGNHCLTKCVFSDVATKSICCTADWTSDKTCISIFNRKYIPFPPIIMEVKKWDVSNIHFLSFRLNFPLPWLWEKGYTFYIFIHAPVSSQPSWPVPKPWFPAISTVKKPGVPDTFHESSWLFDREFF